jgi:hypothetical protein
MWQTSWRCPWMQRPPAYTVNEAPTRCRGCSARTSLNSARDTSTSMPPGSDDSACNESAQPSSASLTLLGTGESLRIDDSAWRVHVALPPALREGSIPAIRIEGVAPA